MGCRVASCTRVRRQGAGRRLPASRGGSGEPDVRRSCSCWSPVRSRSSFRSFPACGSPPFPGRRRRPRLLYVAAPVRMFPAGLSGGGGDVGIGALCACMRGRGQGRDPSCRDTVARQRRGARGICGGCESIGTMRSRRSHSHKALGLKMPQGKRIKIRSRDVAKATREVGALSQHVPVEVALNGLTARH